MYYTLYVKIKRIQQIGEDKTMSELERVETGLGEECGVFGIYSPDGADVVSACYHGLYALQHRGQESAGIAGQSLMFGPMRSSCSGSALP